MTLIATLKKISFYSLLVGCLLAKANTSNAQLIVYTNDTGGVLTTIAAHVTADTLKRVNNATRLSTPCTHGFSTKGFTNATAFSDTMEAVQVKVAPAASYNLKVDTLKVDLRNSPTGPSKARFAYSINNGSTWIPQSTDQIPNPSGTCDSMVTCKWTVPVTVVYPNTLLFRVYGYNASVSTGTGNLQILNLIINGTANSTLGTSQVAVNANELTVYPNPTNASSTISYQITETAPVALSVYNVVGQVVSNLVENSNQSAGSYSYNFDAAAPGIYYVKLTVGNQSSMTKLIKL